MSTPLRKLQSVLLGVTLIVSVALPVQAQQNQPTVAAVNRVHQTLLKINARLTAIQKILGKIAKPVAAKPRPVPLKNWRVVVTSVDQSYSIWFEGVKIGERNKAGKNLNNRHNINLFLQNGLRTAYLANSTGRINTLKAAIRAANTKPELELTVCLVTDGNKSDGVADHITYSILQGDRVELKPKKFTAVVSNSATMISQYKIVKFQGVQYLQLTTPFRQALSANDRKSCGLS